MSSRVVPGSRITICDRCKREGPKDGPGPFVEGGYHLTGVAWGAAAAESDAPCFDFCAGCAGAFRAWLAEGVAPP